MHESESLVGNCLGIVGRNPHPETKEVEVGFEEQYNG
jgi:hypothetical protein